MCTEIGCVDGLQIDTAKASPWPPGAYTFAFVLDGTKVTCAGALPLKACEAGASLACDVPDRVEIGESGCALPPAEHGFAGIHVRGAPARFELTIAHDGKVLGEFDLAPKYTTSRPNGPGCEPECNSAAARIELP